MRFRRRVRTATVPTAWREQPPQSPGWAASRLGKESIIQYSICDVKPESLEIFQIHPSLLLGFSLRELWFRKVIPEGGSRICLGDRFTEHGRAPRR